MMRPTLPTSARASSLVRKSHRAVTSSLESSAKVAVMRTCIDSPAFLNAASGGWTRIAFTSPLPLFHLAPRAIHSRVRR